MKALIVYASWSGHQHATARAIATELARRGFAVTDMPIARLSPTDVSGYDLLVLGTETHGGRASPRMRAFCEAIPLGLFDRVEVAIFGTQVETQQQGVASGVQELEALLAQRGIELALPPLVIELPEAAFLTELGGGGEKRRRIAAFADDLWEATVPEPMI